MKRILFIVPPYLNISSFKEGGIDSVPVFTIPYGILSMVAYLRKYSSIKPEVEILDLNLETFKVLNNSSTAELDLHELLYDICEKRLAQITYDIVGISALFNNAYVYLEKLSKIIKNAVGSPLCIIGGGLASNLYREIITNIREIDGVCLAEGEIPMLELVNSSDMYKLLESHNSWITYSKIKCKIRFQPSYIYNLDEIPIIDYDLIPLEYYNSRSLDRRYASDNNKREFSIHTSRGCPYNCVYCSNTSIHGRKVRYMSIERVMQEIDYMINKHNMNVLLIEDDHFLVDTNRAIAILNEIAKRNIRVEFPNGISVKGITEEIGASLMNAGVSAVNLAVESGSDYVLKKIIGKPHRAEHVKSVVEILRNNDIRVHAFIVLGLPGELREHREETLNLIKDAGFDWVYFFLAVPIVGSRLYDICIDNDYLVEKDFSKHFVANATIKAPGVDPDTIEKEMYLMNLEANFVANWNVRNRNYEIALPYFESLVKKHPNHALAYYVLFHIYRSTNRNGNKIRHVEKRYNELIDSNSEWREYAEHFKLNLLTA